MDTVFLYAVSSMRRYDNEEIYYGTDGIFSSREGALSYIREDMAETALSEGFSFDAKDVDLSRFRTDFSIEDPDTGHRFSWSLDTIFFDLDELCSSLKRERHRPVCSSR